MLHSRVSSLFPLCVIVCCVLSPGPTPSSSRENTREAGIDDFVPDGSGEVNKFLDDEGVEEGDEVDVGGSEDSEEGR